MQPGTSLSLYTTHLSPEGEKVYNVSDNCFRPTLQTSERILTFKEGRRNVTEFAKWPPDVEAAPAAVLKTSRGAVRIILQNFPQAPVVQNYEICIMNAWTFCLEEKKLNFVSQ